MGPLLVLLLIRCAQSCLRAFALPVSAALGVFPAYPHGSTRPHSELLAQPPVYCSIPASLHPLLLSITYLSDIFTYVIDTVYSSIPVHY